MIVKLYLVCLFICELSIIPTTRFTVTAYNFTVNDIYSSRTGNRTGKFLFDAIFGFEDLISGATDGEEKETVKDCNCDCGISTLETRIVGGVAAGLNQFPWVARLVYNGQFHCGASLINTNYVLTAAHCVRRLQRNKIRVILGDHNQFVTTDTVAKMRAVSAIIRHRSFDTASYNHDIALLKLRKPIEFTKNIRPVCLPDEGTDPAGKVGTVIGWGRTSEGGVLPAEIQKVDVPILTSSECRNMKYKSSRITANMLCAGGKAKGKDSCQGDSGGPLLVRKKSLKYEMVGIVSWGVGCGRVGYPGVYTRVAKYIPWIKANLNEGCYCKD